MGSSSPAYHRTTLHKVALTKQVLDRKASTLALEYRLANFLILNLSTPHTATGQSPAELFLRRQIRNCFTLLKPNLNRAVEEKQVKQKEYHDERRVKFREFKLKELVLVRNWRGGVEKWISGRISTHLPCSLWEPNYFCPCGSLERNWLQPFL